MFQAIIQGILWGLLLSLLIGPIFFLLIKTSLERGVKDAVILDMGVVTGDILAILVAYFGLAAVFQNVLYQKWMGIIGGTILFAFGVVPFLKKKKKITDPAEAAAAKLELKTSTNYFWMCIKGFFLNLTNPFVWLYWIACVGVAVSQFAGNKWHVFVYFTSCIITFFGIDVLKIYLASKIRAYLTIRRFRQINNVASISIAIFGLVLIFRVLKL